MTDKNISAEREATDRLRDELHAALGKIMGIRSFNPSNSKEQLKKVEVQIQSALRNHNIDTHAARFDLLPK